MSISRFLLAAIALSAIVASGCTDDPVFPAQGIQVTSEDMPSLAGGAIYELWLSYPPEAAREKEPGIEHNEPEYFSVGRFSVDASGTLRSPDGSGPAAFTIPPGYNPSLVGEAIVSIEATADTDGKPDALFLASDITGGADQGHAVLVAPGRRTFDTSALRDVQGSFVLEAPTSDESGDQLSGIWFVRHERNPVTGDSLSPSTTLRILPLHHDNDNWVYEAWLVNRSGAAPSYRSLGRFRNPSVADSTGAGPEAGPNPLRAYAYPGEDFVTSRRMLNDSALGVIISLQPESIALTSPVLQVLERTSIGGDAVPRSDLFMVRSPLSPTIEIRFER